MIKFKMFKSEQVLNIFKITCYQVIHSYNVKAFFYKTVA